MVDGVKSDLAAFVAVRRCELGITQEQLADRSGLRRDAIAGIESGKSKKPLPDTRRKLAAGLGVSHEAILIAAGELLPEEASRPLEPPRYAPGSGYAAVLCVLDRMADDEARLLAEAGLLLLRHRRT